MKGAEVICVGSELLLGQILNTNAQYLAVELAALGIPHHFQTVVGDNEARIHEVLRVAESRATVLILTGGLGPTPDDLTHEALASYFGVPMVEQPGLWTELVAKFTARGRIATAIQRKQCCLPEGAEVLPNPWGTAVGLCWQVRPDLQILTFPGVPQEMTRMWQATAVPYLKNLGWGNQIIVSELMRFWGVGEAIMAQKVQHLLARINPTVAPYASQGEVHLRVTACAGDRAAAEVLMAPVIAEIRQLAGSDYFGSGETTLAQVVGDQLTSLGQTLAIAESCTGGLLGQRLTDRPGSSAYFKGGIIAYEDALKTQLLDVAPELLKVEGAVSAPVALAMAQGVRQRLASDWGIGISGVAGPGGGTATKPVGLVHIAVVGPGTSAQEEYRFGTHQSRSFIRWLTVHSALDGLRRILLEKF